MARCPDLVEFGWCGLCYSGVRGRRTYKGHARYRPSVPWLKGCGDVPLSKPVRVDSAPPEGAASGGPWDGLAVPTLCSFLCDRQWADGSPRVAGSLLVFTESGAWKCCLLDKDSDQQAFLTAETFATLLETVDRALESNRVDWKKRWAPKGRKA